MRLIDADELIRKTAEAYFEAMGDETLSEYVLDGMNIVRTAVANAVSKAPTISLDINEFIERLDHEKVNCEILADANNGERDYYAGKAMGLMDAKSILKACIVRTAEGNESTAQDVDKE